ncbi:MAG: DnaJ C-terminal domain-containing protein [Nitriliruptoraceae bacterium]
MADLYAVLGVAPDAPPEEVKRAYRRLAREHHPDAGGDEARFKEVAHAYDVLGDAERRARYDRFGDDGQGGGRGGDFGFGGIGDVIDAFFGGFGQGFGGGGGGQRRDRAGRDVLVGVELTLDEVLTGVAREVAVEVASVCERCDGGGSADGRPPARCARCGGAGPLRRAGRPPLGNLTTASPCPDCEGTGRTATDPCRACRGEGRVVRARTVAVDLPAGLEDGDRIPLRGQGEAGRQGAPSGDLYVQVQVADHPSLARDGTDLHTIADVPVTVLLLGGRVVVGGVGDERHEVEVAAGTRPGTPIVVRRAGLPVRGGGRRGDLVVHLAVDVPAKLRREERELVARLAALRGEADGPHDAAQRRP